MLADYMSRNLVSTISWDSNELLQAQNADPLIKALQMFLLNKELPHDTKFQSLIKLFSNDCFIKEGLIWRPVKHQFEPSQVILFLPTSLVPEALVEARGKLLTEHDGIYKTKERLMQCFYWPGGILTLPLISKVVTNANFSATKIDPHQCYYHHYPYQRSLINECMRTFSAH
jgi:hypothetical protein